jgi:glycosyltransferase involved in cell wall biosynthesis
MRIAQLSSNVERVPPAGYGGTELVVSLLTDELIERGHEVHLFGVGGSNTRANLVSVVDQPMRTADIPVRRWPAYDIMLLMKLREMRDRFDIIHNHMGWQALPWLAEIGLPVVNTNHNLVKSYCSPIYLGYKYLPYVAISEAYRRLNYPDELNYVATIYNGIDLERLTFEDAQDVFHEPMMAGAMTSTTRSQTSALSDKTHRANTGRERTYLLFLGRLCQDKGTKEAIEIARKLAMPLVIAGKVDPADQRYFDECVKPFINDDDIKFIGEVNHEAKVSLYRGAVATVYPINFDEPFGLVMAESMATGTPVMAFDRGSVREVLSEGETAVIGKTVDELVSRFDEVKGIRPEKCRQRVEALFSKRQLVDSYEVLYGRWVDLRSSISP